ERTALHGDVALLLEDGDALLDDEVGGGGQCADRGEGDEEARRDADAAEREPGLQAHVLALQQVASVLVHLAPELLRAFPSSRASGLIKPRRSVHPQFTLLCRRTPIVAAPHEPGDSLLMCGKLTGPSGASNRG